MITIIGTGRVGSTLASQLAAEELDDITLIDIVKGLPQGEALDIGHMATQYAADVDLVGSNDYQALAGSDIVILVAGLARRPDMTRMDLLNKNTGIIKQVAEQIKQHAPNSKVMMITNPMDVMTYVALKVTGFPTNRVFGMGGMLDSSRYRNLLAKTLGVSYSSVNGMVIGEHGESMTPLASRTSINGIPLKELLGEEKTKEAVEKTRKIAAEVIALKGATFYAPAQGVVKMVESIVKDKRCVYPVCTYLNGQYGVSDVCIGVPVVLGKNGIERIIEVPLEDSEKEYFMKGVQSIKAAISSIQI
ncbi:MAG: malate dehydrogenase [Thaumarchaeota archaeon]|nr:malate dehydrogenase [Nitrososphaerota archaeon]